MGIPTKFYLNFIFFSLTLHKEGGRRRYGDSHQLLSELHFFHFSFFFDLEDFPYLLTFRYPCRALIRVVLNLIKVIPVGIAYIYSLMRCYKVRDNSGRNCVHLRNNPLR